VTARFRARWDELQADVWPRFSVQGVFLERQAQSLLGLMVDLARSGSPDDMRINREALAEVERLEDILRSQAEAMLATLAAHAELTRCRYIDGGIEPPDVEPLRAGAQHLLAVNWAAPRLLGIDYSDAVQSRKTAADALRLLLLRLDSAQLDPVSLTDRARATIYNVTHDAQEPYAPEDVKTARQRLRQGG
jgi:hypothetical protein